MRKFTFFLGLVIMMSASMIWADLDDSENKIYLNASELVLVDQGMYACIQGEWVSVNAVYSDPLGIYIVGAKYPNSRWICRAAGCYYNNEGKFETCQKVDQNTGKKCGAPRPPG